MGDRQLNRYEAVKVLLSIMPKYECELKEAIDYAVKIIADGAIKENELAIARFRRIHELSGEILDLAKKGSES